MNKFVETLDKARKSSNQVIVNIASKIDSRIALYRTLHQLQKMTPNITDNFIHGFDGKETFHPTVSSLEAFQNKNQDNMKENLFVISTLFEVIEEYFEIEGNK